MRKPRREVDKALQFWSTFPALTIGLMFSNSHLAHGMPMWAVILASVGVGFASGLIGSVALTIWRRRRTRRNDGIS